ncbi:MAG: DUF3800 domain-containing protein [Phycisphaerales bacterium]|nr:MAG: DUF3800 domain-containing protein [Phycisphaerales bacterium]
MHLMYVDESGDCGYPPSGDFPLTGGPTRFFVRAGVVLHGWKWMHIDKRIADLKQSGGLTWDQEIKATHLRAGKGAFSGWSPSDRRQFLFDLLDTIGREIDVRLLVVAIDKSRIDRGQRERFTNPAVRSLELLLERYNFFLREQTDKSGIAILDTVESKSDENLRYFQSYLLRFSDHLDPRRIVEGALFMPSHASNLLQLADVCTNVLYRRYARADGNEEEYKRIVPLICTGKVWPD